MALLVREGQALKDADEGMGREERDRNWTLGYGMLRQAMLAVSLTSLVGWTI